PARHPRSPPAAVTVSPERLQELQRRVARPTILGRATGVAKMSRSGADGRARALECAPAHDLAAWLSGCSDGRVLKLRFTWRRTIEQRTNFCKRGSHERRARRTDPLAGR